MGYAVHCATVRPQGKHAWQTMALYMFAANAADLDFLPGLLLGEPNRYHHGITHSLGCAVLFASAVSLLRFLHNSAAIWRHFGILFALYCSHIALDYLAIDTRFPFGVPLFWPMSHDYYIAPFPFLPDIRRATSSLEFFPSLFTRHNLWAVSVEVALLGPFILLLHAWQKHPRAALVGHPTACRENLHSPGNGQR